MIVLNKHPSAQYISYALAKFFRNCSKAYS